MTTTMDRDVREQINDEPSAPNRETVDDAPTTFTSANLGDLGAIAALLLLQTFGFTPVFTGALHLNPLSPEITAGMGGIILGLLIACLGKRYRLNALVVAALVGVAYLLFGGFFALRDSTIGGVVPTFETLIDLLYYSVTSWKQFITASIPVTGYTGLLVVPFLLMLVTAALAGSLVLRSPHSQRSVPPLLISQSVVALLGTSQPYWQLYIVQGLGFLFLGIGWLLRRSEVRAQVLDSAIEGPGGEFLQIASESSKDKTLTMRRTSQAVGMLVAAAIAGFAMISVAPDDDRVALRDQLTPPLDAQNYPTPLARFRSYVKDHKSETLLSVNQLPAGTRVQIAKLEQYDGTAFGVSNEYANDAASFRRVGSAIAGEFANTQPDVTVSVDAYSGPWVPTVAATTGFTFAGDNALALADTLYYNVLANTALATHGLRSGDTYTLGVSKPTTYPDAQIGDKSAVANTFRSRTGAIPETVRAQAVEFSADAKTDIERARSIETRLSNGYFSHGLDGQQASASGHSASRIDQLLASTEMVGDDEQYATAMALMVRQLGMSSRVVVGFKVEDDAGSNTPVDFRGADIKAWVEIEFEDLGWVTFDPTPPEDRELLQQSERPVTDPEPLVLQPPPPPQEPGRLPPMTDGTGLADNEIDDDDSLTASAPFLIIVGVTGSLLILALPFILILGAKAIRRNRRKTAENSLTAVSGGWLEVLDAAEDLGMSVPRGATRRESARVLNEMYPRCGAVMLAERTDAEVFCGREPSQDQVESIWSQVHDVTSTMLASVSKPKKLRARLSLRSLRIGRQLRLRRSRKGGLFRWR